jgi:predicted nucleic acid-binding Zn ribbon protein
MERITREVKQELSRFGAQGALPQVVEAWPELVGPMVAGNAWPARIARDGTLYVNTSSSSWAFELGQLGGEIAAKLEQRLGEKAPKALRFAVGHLPEPAAVPRAERSAGAPEPTPEALQTAAGVASAIEHEELRRTVERAASLGLSRPPSDHSF